MLESIVEIVGAAGLALFLLFLLVAPFMIGTRATLPDDNDDWDPRSPLN